MKLFDRFLGVMFGGACGDALGVATEFLTPDKFGYVTDFQGRAKFRSKPGDYTDDTAQALCLAQSLLDCNGFNIEDQLDKYLKRFSDGYMSSLNRCFGIGHQTSDRLFKYKQYKEGKIAYKPREEDLSNKQKEGNGSLMKIGSIPLFYFNNIKEAVFYASESVKAIHNTDLCKSCAEFFVELIWLALHGYSKETLKKFNTSSYPRNICEHNIHPLLKPILNKSWETKEKSLLGQKYGYVIDSLEIALRGFFMFDSFEEGMLQIVNLGNDADTNACMYGYLAGAYYGYDAIPERWKEKITNKKLIADITEKIFYHCELCLDDKTITDDSYYEWDEFIDEDGYAVQSDENTEIKIYEDYIRYESYIPLVFEEYYDFAYKLKGNQIMIKCINYDRRIFDHTPQSVSVVKCHLIENECINLKEHAKLLGKKLKEFTSRKEIQELWNMSKGLLNRQSRRYGIKAEDWIIQQIKMQNFKKREKINLPSTTGQVPLEQFC